MPHIPISILLILSISVDTHSGYLLNLPGYFIVYIKPSAYASAHLLYHTLNDPCLFIIHIYPQCYPEPAFFIQATSHMRDISLKETGTEHRILTILSSDLIYSLSSISSLSNFCRSNRLYCLPPFICTLEVWTPIWRSGVFLSHSLSNTRQAARNISSVTSVAVSNCSCLFSWRNSQVVIWTLTTPIFTLSFRSLVPTVSHKDNNKWSAYSVLVISTGLSDCSHSLYSSHVQTYMVPSPCPWHSPARSAPAVSSGILSPHHLP